MVIFCRILQFHQFPEWSLTTLLYANECLLTVSITSSCVTKLTIGCSLIDYFSCDAGPSPSPCLISDNSTPSARLTILFYIVFVKHPQVIGKPVKTKGQ